VDNLLVQNKEDCDSLIQIRETFMTQIRLTNEFIFTSI